MPGLEWYNRVSSSRLFSRGLIAEKHARNASKSWSLYCITVIWRIKNARTSSRADGVLDCSSSSRIVGIGHRPSYPKVRARVLENLDQR
jgi:hypothetical protein